LMAAVTLPVRGGGVRRTNKQTKRQTDRQTDGHRCVKPSCGGALVNYTVAVACGYNLVGAGGFVGCMRHIQVRDVTVDVRRGGVTSVMTRCGVTIGDCDVSVVTWCHRPRTCRHASDDCLPDACDCNDIARRKFCLFCKPSCNYVICASISL